MTTAVVFRRPRGAGAPLNILGRAPWRVSPAAAALAGAAPVAAVPVAGGAHSWQRPAAQRPASGTRPRASAWRPHSIAAPAHKRCPALHAVRGAAGRSAAAAHPSEGRTRVGGSSNKVQGLARWQ